MRDKRLSLLNNWIFKAIFITVVPFFIGLFNNNIKWVDENGKINIFNIEHILIIILIFSYIVYVIYIAYIEKKESLNKINIEKLQVEKENLLLASEIYDMVFKSLGNLIDISQKDINELTKQIINSNNQVLLNWNLENIANYICRDIVNILSKVSKNGTDISVNIYIRHKKKLAKRTQDYIQMIAHWGGTNSTPSILNTDILLTKKKNWQYAKLFLDNNPKIVVYPSEEEIRKNFEYNGSPDKYVGEYTQYIGIPISCSGGNILSSLEIISHHGTIIADTKDEILGIINKYIIVYRNYALLTHKIEKSLKAKHFGDNKGEELK